MFLQLDVQATRWDDIGGLESVKEALRQVQLAKHT